MNKTAIPEIMRAQYKVYHSQNGVDYESREISMFEMVHICDYYYKDYDRVEAKNLPDEVKQRLFMPVYFHHNDYWIVDGFDLSLVIAKMTSIHKRDWRKFINGKWRLHPDWLSEWYRAHRDE